MTKIARMSVLLGAAMALAPSIALAAGEVAPGENPYGLKAALEQGGIIAQATFFILVLMSVISWFIIISKFFEQKKILDEAKNIDRVFWKADSLDAGRAKLPKNSPFRQLVDDGLAAAEHHEGKLTDKIDQHEWVTMSLARSNNAINSKLSSGLAFLASVGSTAPFIGLFGTVVGIYRALINIGIAGQASIDKVAGPVGEALIMTALGLAVAVPAVLGYNWLLRRNKSVSERLNNFASDVHAMLVSGGRVTAPAASVAVPTGGPSGSITSGQAVRKQDGQA